MPSVLRTAFLSADCIDGCSTLLRAVRVTTSSTPGREHSARNPVETDKDAMPQRKSASERENTSSRHELLFAAGSRQWQRSVDSNFLRRSYHVISTDQEKAARTMPPRVTTRTGRKRTQDCHLSDKAGYPDTEFRQGTPSRGAYCAKSTRTNSTRRLKNRNASYPRRPSKAAGALRTAGISATGAGNKTISSRKELSSSLCQVGRAKCDAPSAVLHSAQRRAGAVSPSPSGEELR